MGGYGSGRSPGARRPVEDELFSLDVRDLARSGALQPGGHGEGTLEMTYPDRTRLRLSWWVSCHGDSIELRHRHDGRDERRRNVALKFTPCHYGGSRPWFACPCCGDRAAILYLWGPTWNCRRCAVPFGGVRYRTQYLDPGRRADRKVEKLKQRLTEELRRPAQGSRLRPLRVRRLAAELDAAKAVAWVHLLRYLQRMDAYEAQILARCPP